MNVSILWLLWLLLAGTAAWRVILSVLLLMHPTLPQMLGAAVVHWRRLDEGLPWLAIAVLLLASDGAARSLGQLRGGRLIALLCGLGAAFSALSIAFDQADFATSTAAPLALGGYLVMGAVGLILAIRALRMVYGTLRTGSGRGVTIIDLWRFAAAQWALLMAAAFVWVALATPKDQRLGNELIRTLFFFLPAAAVLPNAMMAGGIALWSDMLLASGSLPAVPRVRAWLMAFAAMNLGPMILLAGLLPRLHASWLFFPGAGLELLGVAFYLAGFPTAAWRGVGGKALLAAWVLLAVALGAALIEQSARLNEAPVSVFYGAAWRYVWVAGAATFWLLGQGVHGLQLLLSDLKARRAGGAAIALATLGLMLTVAVLLTAATRSGEAQVPVMRWMIVGTGIGLLTTMLAGVVMMQAAWRRDH